MLETARLRTKEQSVMGDVSSATSMQKPLKASISAVKDRNMELRGGAQPGEAQI